MALYCDYNCFENAICDFCRFYIFKDEFCTKDNKGMDPIDTCANFECEIAYRRGESDG